jgi:hypothetical protein
MKKIFISLSLLIYSVNTIAFNGIEDYETTRTKAMAGAGVASILLNEAPLFNPASIVFFNKSSLYYQKDSNKLKKTSSTRTSDFKTEQNELVLFTDTSAAFKGGLTYQYQNEQAGKRSRISTSLARNLGKKSAIGLTYRYTQEDSAVIDDNYSQIVLGSTFIHDKSLTFGFVIVDPAQKVSEYFRYTAGVQYSLKDFINLIIDVGSGDTHNYEKESFTKWSLQLQSFERFFLRYGRFHDQLTNRKGTGSGISWVGPRFSLDFAYKVSELISQKTDIILTDEQIVESSLGLTVLF